jgi:gas vesicle protein
MTKEPTCLKEEVKMANIQKHQKSKVIKGTVLGGIAGAMAGILLAPKSGKEMRQNLTAQINKIENKAEDMKYKAQSAWQNIEGKTQVTVNTGKSYLQKGKRYFKNLQILVCEIRNGALTKTDSVDEQL